MGTILAGVYAICNFVTGEGYIGITGDVVKRRRGHWSMLRAGTHPNFALQRAWERDGERSFALVVLEYLPIKETISTRNRRERHWMGWSRAAGIVLYNDQVQRGRRRAA